MTTNQHRARLALMARHSRHLNVTPCAHPFRSLRFDGLQHGHPDGTLAQVTCMAAGCRTSMLIPVREDVAQKSRQDRADVNGTGHGGPLGPAVGSVMGQQYEARP